MNKLNEEFGTFFSNSILFEVFFRSTLEEMEAPTCLSSWKYWSLNKHARPPVLMQPFERPCLGFWKVNTRGWILPPFKPGSYLEWFFLWRCLGWESPSWVVQTAAILKLRRSTAEDLDLREHSWPACCVVMGSSGGGVEGIEVSVSQLLVMMYLSNVAFWRF